MSASKDRILIVESDPEISDFIGRQALSSAGFQAFTVNDASSAIAKILQISPDLIITDIKLPGLSGKDLMVALSSQGINIPIIVIARDGQESEVIQTFRLGAVDYLMWPCQEPEIIRSVERIIQQIHEHRDRNILEKRLSEINHQLQQRVRELTAIFSMGKAVTSITDQRALFEKINHVAAQVTQADVSWFLTREEEKEKKFILVAQKNLPDPISELLLQSWDDGVSSLVVMSGESLRLHGDPLRRFRVKSIGQAIMVVPVKVQRQVMGILVVMRKEANPFSDSDQHLLEAVADYASISLVNARLFRAIEARAQALQALANHALANEKITQEKLATVEQNLHESSAVLLGHLDELTQDVTARWNPGQRKNLTFLKEDMKNFDILANTINPIRNSFQFDQESVTDLTILAGEIEKRFSPIVSHYNLSYKTSLPEFPIQINSGNIQIQEILQGLITNAIQFCQEKGEIAVAISQISNSHCQIDVTNTGVINSKLSKSFFQKFKNKKDEKIRFAGIGISLELIQEIIRNLDGKIWVDQNDENKTAFHVSIPIANSKA
jgi:DNA-binding response OmpR family regulator